LFPFDHVHDYSQNAFKKYNENDEIVTGDYSILERLGLVSEYDGIIRPLFDHYKRLLPYYIVPLIFFVFGYLVNNEQLMGIFPLYIAIFFFMGILLSLYKWQNNHFNLVKTFDRMPFQIHENYKKSYSFLIFQNKIIDRLGIYKKPDLWIWFFVTVFMVTILTLLMRDLLTNLVLSNNFLAQFLLFLGLIIFITGIYIYYLIFAVIGSSLIDIFYRLQFLFRNVPIKLDPWDKSYGIQGITAIWSSAIVTYIVVSWIFPAFISYKSTSEFLYQLMNAADKWSIIQDLFSNSGFLFLIVGNLFVISTFIYSIYLLYKNIDARKDELKNRIKERIERISNQETVTNQELSQISFMKLEYPQIEKIPSIPIPYGFVLTVIYAIINVIVVIYGLLH